MVLKSFLCRELGRKDKRDDMRNDKASYGGTRLFEQSDEQPKHLLTRIGNKQAGESIFNSELR
jgi:hypothetical protein